jgi:23S rRNA (uracil1939-C5)-methyltransferase
MAAADTVQFLQRAKYRPTIVTLDPPRTGAPALIEVIAKLRPQRIIYVSCDVTTLVRDLRVLTRRGYGIGQVAGFDFFPHTHHVEVVAEAVLT